VTVTLALAGHINNMLGEYRVRGFALAIEASPTGLNALPRIIQRAAHNLNCLGVEHPWVVIEIPDHSSSSLLMRERDRSLSHRMPVEDPMMY
jgi:hypothetical protein